MIDAHHHFWRFREEEYGWMDASMKILQRDFLPEHLEPELAKAGVEGTVLVQARQLKEETESLLKLAEKYPWIRGVVGWVDLCSELIGEHLQDFAPHPKLVGFRHVVHDEADDDFMLRKDFQRGIAALGDFNLAYDLLIFPQHLGRARKLVAGFPQQTFVLDHLGKPEIRSGSLQPWKGELEKLAAYPGVYCKLSGMVTEANWKHWTYEDFECYMETVLQAFGPERLMLGSDWPVCRLAGEYEEVLAIPLRFIQKLSREEQAFIRHKTATHCYQLQTEIYGEEEI